MPRIALDPANKTENVFDYPRLKLKKGERARILVIEPEPLFEFSHTLQAPELMNGEPVWETIKDRQGNDTKVMKRTFIGRHICIGDFETLRDKGIDKERCPVCKASTESDAVRPPERRFALHIISYVLKPGTEWVVAEPFQVNLLAWAFGDNIYNKLTDIAAEWGDLREHDLNLGPCTVEQFQKFEMQVASRAEWLVNNQRKAMTVELYKHNQCKDLSQLIGRRLTIDQVNQDLQTVLQRYAQAYKHGSTPGVDVPSGDEIRGSLDLDSLLGGGTPDGSIEADADGPTGGVPADPPASLDALAGLLKDEDAADASRREGLAELASAAANESMGITDIAATVAASAPASEPEKLDFDALLNDLG